MAITSRRRGDPFRLNEPSPRIAGGARRPSTVLTDRAFSQIRGRARLERLLLQHDPDGASMTLSPHDMGVLRQMAIEGAITNQVPAIRRGAMMLLAASPTPENLNLLTDLAVSGEDVYVRSHALLALGATGLKIAAAFLLGALKSGEDQERQVAETGLRLLAGRVGPGILTSLRRNERDADLRRALDRLVAMLTEKRPKPRRRRISARETTRRAQ